MCSGAAPSLLPSAAPRRSVNLGFGLILAGIGTLFALWRRADRSESSRVSKPIAPAAVEQRPEPEPIPVASAPVVLVPLAPKGEQELTYDEQVILERKVVQEAVRTVQLIRRTKAAHSVPHRFAVDKQLLMLERQLGDVADNLGGNFFWRCGRDEPMAELLSQPLLQVAGSRDSMVPVTLGFVKQTKHQGDLAIARFLLQGTDPEMSRYREYSSGILDSLRRERLLKVLLRLFWPVWDIPLIWGDEDDQISFGQDNAHSVSAFGVAMRTQWDGMIAPSGCST